MRITPNTTSNICRDKEKNRIAFGYTFQAPASEDIFKAFHPQFKFEEEQAEPQKPKKRNIRLIVATIIQLGIMAACLAAFLKKSKKPKEVEGLFKPERGRDGFFSSLAIRLNNLKLKHAELTNNIIYAVGSVVVMPLVIIFSPFGKKKSTLKDKVFTAMRQPVSFMTMFSFQLFATKYVKENIMRLADEGYLSNAYKAANRTAMGNKKLVAIEKFAPIVFNILTVPISATLLNIFYGNLMKKLKPEAYKTGGDK